MSWMEKPWISQPSENIASYRTSMRKPKNQYIIKKEERNMHTVSACRRLCHLIFFNDESNPEREMIMGSDIRHLELFPSDSRSSP